MNFGEKLRLMRTEKGWSQPELAEKLGIEQSYLSKLENGHSMPSGEMLDNILGTFGVPLAKFLEDIEGQVVKKHLASIPQVASHLRQQNFRSSANRRWWMIGAAASFAAGFALMVAGTLQLKYPLEHFQYVSDGIIPLGANGEVFTNLEEYVSYAVGPMELEMVDTDMSDMDIFNQSNREKYRIGSRLAPLGFDDFLSTSEFRGQLFSIEMTAAQDQEILTAAGVTTGGTRTYTFAGTETINNSWDIWLIVIGSFLTVWGLLAVAIGQYVFNQGDAIPSHHKDAQ